jgi:hypothetical protein
LINKSKNFASILCKENILEDGKYEVINYKRLSNPIFSLRYVFIEDIFRRINIIDEKRVDIVNLDNFEIIEYIYSYKYILTSY